MTLGNTNASHTIFFNFLTNKKLKELLHRADPKSYDKVLETHINSILKEQTPLYAEVIIDSINPTCSIYIDLYIKNKKPKKQVAHVTIHLYKNNVSISRNVGRIHVKNNRTNKGHVAKFDQVDSDSIRITFIEFPNQISESLNKPFQIIENILNEYFHEQSPLFLGNQLTKNSTLDHPCLDLTIQEMKRTKTPIKAKTLKRNKTIQYKYRTVKTRKH